MTSTLAPQSPTVTTAAGVPRSGDDASPFAWSNWRTGTGQDQIPGVDSGLDLDVIEYLRWAHDLRGLAANTLRIRGDVLNRLHAFTGTPLRHIAPGQVLRFERACIAGRAPETRRSYCSHLHAFYRWAAERGIVTADPTTMLTAPVVPKGMPRPISEEDLATAIRAARPKMAAMLILGSFAGLRCCEMAGLDWPDVRRETDAAGWLYVRKGKGCRERTVEIGRTVIDALQRYGPRRRGPVFLGHEGRRIDPRSVSGGINRHLARLGIDATAHQLRHRYASTAYELSRDLRMVQEMLGHASSRTTEIYTRPSAEAASRMVAAMDARGLPD